jgi:hypothetical protein
MSFQAYIDNVKAKTGKTPEDFVKLATRKGLTTHSETVAWLKKEFALGHGHATAIAGIVLKASIPKASPEQKLDVLFGGRKAHWRNPAENLITQFSRFGSDVSVSAGKTYINLLRAGKKFGILQPSSAERLDIGIKLKGKAARDRFEPAGTWNAMVTHRVRIIDARDIDAEILSWLKSAYEAV